MLITRKSPLTGKENSMEIDIHPEELGRWMRGVLIQVVAPHLTPDEREFIVTGYTAEDWAKIFPPEEDEDLDDDGDGLTEYGE